MLRRCASRFGRHAIRVADDKIFEGPARAFAFGRLFRRRGQGASRRLRNRDGLDDAVERQLRLAVLFATRVARGPFEGRGFAGDGGWRGLSRLRGCGKFNGRRRTEDGRGARGERFVQVASKPLDFELRSAAHLQHAIGERQRCLRPEPQLIALVPEATA